MKKIFLFILGFAVFNSAIAQSDSLNHYSGKYTFPEGSPVTEINVVIEGGVLSASSSMGSTELKKTDTKDVFEIVVYGGTATFKRNAEGKVIAVQIVVGDISMEGSKSEGRPAFSNKQQIKQLEFFYINNDCYYY